MDGPIEDLELSKWNEMIDINLWVEADEGGDVIATLTSRSPRRNGTFLGTKWGIRSMKENKGGPFEGSRRWRCRGSL